MTTVGMSISPASSQIDRPRVAQHSDRPDLRERQVATIEHIIVQAGGKGTRLEHLTANKPKALVPVANLPMLFHLFRRFPDKRFIVIADYHRDVLREYLAAFAQVKYQVVDAAGSGTCGGIRQALQLLPDDSPFMLMWSDLILPGQFELPDGDCDRVGISETFECRWSYEDGSFVERASSEHGVAGLFTFTDSSALAEVPESGEFVRWLQERRHRFTELGLGGTREFGLLSEYQLLATDRTRPFNRATVTADRFTKEPIDAQGRALAARERAWYRHALALGVEQLPRLYELEPLTMEKIDGASIHEYSGLGHEAKLRILTDVTAALKDLHDRETAAVDTFSVREAYYGKTIARLASIRDLIPHADRRTIIVNGRECRNVFFYKRDLERALAAIPVDRFAFIHGDPTFSNLMLRGGIQPVLIDPRGYFGYTELYGDPNYDWAKLYYSVAGNYDQFNLKRFRLDIAAGGVELTVDSGGWEDLAEQMIALSGADPHTIKLLHAVIWLSLTTYAWQDYDSICGAFYNGIHHLEEAL